MSTNWNWKAAFYAVVVMLALVQLSPYIKLATSLQGKPIEYMDRVDGVVFHRHLQAIKTPAQVVGLATGNWLGDRTYYRPGTSYTILGLYKVFGGNGLAQFSWFHIGLHLCAMLAFSAMLLVLNFSPLKVVGTVVFFTMGKPIFNLLGVTDPSPALSSWIDIPESMVLLLGSLLIIAFSKYWDGRRMGWYLATIALYIAALSFKETALMFIPVLLVITAFRERRRLTDYIPLGAPLFLITAGWLLHRHALIAAADPSMRGNGSNGSWMSRLAELGTGMVGVSVTNNNWLVVGTVLLILGVAIVVACRAPHWLLWLGGVMTGSAFTCYLAEAQELGIGLDAEMARLVVVSADPGIHVLGCLAMVAVLLTAALGIKRRSQGIVLAVTWIVVQSFPVLMASTTAHTRFLASAGWAMLFVETAAIALTYWLPNMHFPRENRLFRAVPT